MYNTLIEIWIYGCAIFLVNKNHIKILEEGVAIWNQWRQENPSVKPDLVNAILDDADLVRADLSCADLRGAHALLDQYSAKLTLMEQSLMEQSFLKQLFMVQNFGEHPLSTLT